MTQQSENHMRWYKEMPNGTERYYSAKITEDLFDTIVLCVWGTKGTKLGGIKSYPVNTQEEAQIILNDVVKKREKRGYILVLENMKPEDVRVALQ